MKTRTFTARLFLLTIAGILLWTLGQALAAGGYWPGYQPRPCEVCTDYRQESPAAINFLGKRQMGSHIVLAQNLARPPLAKPSPRKPILRRPPSKMYNPSVPATKDAKKLYAFTPDLNGIWEDDEGTKFKMQHGRMKDQGSFWIRWFSVYLPLIDGLNGDGSAVGNKLKTRYWYSSKPGDKKTRNGVVEVFYGGWIVPTMDNYNGKRWLRIRWNDGKIWMKSLTKY